MGFYDGVQHTKQARSFWSRPYLQRRKLTWAEYIPLVVLGILMVELFIHVLIPQLIH